MNSPAKLNLWLKITGLREDGYHLIDSLFVAVDLYDEIEIAEDYSLKTDLVEFEKNNKTFEIPDNTVIKALRLLREKNSNLPYQKIKIEKNIPMGAGLGGGSSNAATIIKHIIQKYDLDAEHKIALKIGADVPFFMRGGAAQVTGVGENIAPVKMTPLHFVIANPGVEVSTKQAYGWFDEFSKLTRGASNVSSTSKFGTGSVNLTVDQIVLQMHNDLEKPVEARHPEITNLRKALRKWGALGAQMTGSGSSVFGLFHDLMAAKTAASALRKYFPETHTFFVCSSLGFFDNMENSNGNHRS